MDHYFPFVDPLVSVGGSILSISGSLASFGGFLVSVGGSIVSLGGSLVIPVCAEKTLVAVVIP